MMEFFKEYARAARTIERMTLLRDLIDASVNIADYAEFKAYLASLEDKVYAAERGE